MLCKCSVVFLIKLGLRGKATKVCIVPPSFSHIDLRDFRYDTHLTFARLHLLVSHLIILPPQLYSPSYLPFAIGIPNSSLRPLCFFLCLGFSFSCLILSAHFLFSHSSVMSSLLLGLPWHLESQRTEDHPLRNHIRRLRSLAFDVARVVHGVSRRCVSPVVWERC